MRMMMRISVPVEAGNKAIEDGSLPRVIQETMERVKPESAYFTVQNGVRTAFMFFEMTESTQMPAIGEPLFTHLKAGIDITPVMNAQELQRGLSALAPPRR
ncbi:MAG TPA: hypothetical protein VIU64_24250 [Polyangia bacterium]